MAELFSLVTLVLVLLVPSSLSYLTVETSGEYDNSFTMYGLFSTPYTNIPDNFEGYLYFKNSSCNAIPPPEFLGNITQNDTTIVLVPNYNECIIKKILFAKAAGYNGLLSYTENDDNKTINEALVDTNFPVAIITASVADILIKNATVSLDNTNTLVKISGSIIEGIFVVVICFVFCICCSCCVGIWTCICCKICYDNRRMEREFRLLNERRLHHPNRQELIESILRHLQQLEHDVGAQTPLGSNQSKNLPKREYTKEDNADTCAICVDEFQENVVVRELPCGHIFHPDCIDEWLSNYSSMCPLCKDNLRQRPLNQGVPHLGVMEHGIVSHTGSTNSTDSEISLTREDHNQNRYGTVVR